MPATQATTSLGCWRVRVRPLQSRVVSGRVRGHPVGILPAFILSQSAVLKRVARAPQQQQVATATAAAAASGSSN